jgi:hypothetical protein
MGDLNEEAEGEGGRVVNVTSGSNRARLAAGGDVGGVRIGEREGEAMATGCVHQQLDSLLMKASLDYCRVPEWTARNRYQL